MKEKILAALRAKYPGTQAALLDRIADSYVNTVTDETLETVIASDGVKNLLAFFQTETDRRATEATRTSVANYEKQHNIKDGKPVSAEPPKPDDDPATPAWAKAIIKQNQDLALKVQSLEKGTATTGLMDKVKAKLAYKKIPEIFFDGKTIEKEEDVDALVAKIEGDYQSVKQDLVNKGVVVDVPPSSGPAPAKVDADIDAWRASSNPQKP